MLFFGVGDLLGCGRRQISYAPKKRRVLARADPSPATDRAGQHLQPLWFNVLWEEI